MYSLFNMASNPSTSPPPSSANERVSTWAPKRRRPIDNFYVSYILQCDVTKDEPRTYSGVPGAPKKGKIGIKNRSA